MASNLLAMASIPIAMASNLLAMASIPIAMASNLLAMASIPIAMASNLVFWSRKEKSERKNTVLPRHSWLQISWAFLFRWEQLLTAHLHLVLSSARDQQRRKCLHVPLGKSRNGDSLRLPLARSLPLGGRVINLLVEQLLIFACRKVIASKTFLL